MPHAQFCNSLTADRHFAQVEGWGVPGTNKFDYFNATKSKAFEIEPELEAFLKKHAVLEVYRELVKALKGEGEQLNAARCAQLCFGPGKFDGQLAEKNIDLFLCKATVNAGHEPSKDFLWLEFSANRGYEPDHLYMRRGNTQGFACLIS